MQQLRNMPETLTYMTVKWKKNMQFGKIRTNLDFIKAKGRNQTKMVMLKFSLIYCLKIFIFRDTATESQGFTPPTPSISPTLCCFTLNYCSCVVLQQYSQLHHSAIYEYHGIVGIDRGRKSSLLPRDIQLFHWESS